ncbi:MAG: hypothetical protein OQK49_09485 [Proteobacteria bacterium]|nr:hypothetical protein [Pseudomonadota bacterium]
MTKSKAAGLHFLLSVIFIGGFIVFLNLFWYRHLVGVTGVIEPLKLLVIVDVLIGPLLTFIVYKQGKKTLKFDLSVIVLMQLAAFIYGAFIIYQGKPSWLVFNDNAFEVVYEKEVPNQGDVLKNGGLFSQPKLAYIPYTNQRLGVSAHQNFTAAEALTADKWGEVSYQKITPKEAAALVGLGVDDFKYKIKQQDPQMYRINNDGLLSVMVLKDKENLKFSVMTQFN